MPIYYESRRICIGLYRELIGLPLGNAAVGSDVLGDADARFRDGPQIFFGPIIAEPAGSMSPPRRMKRVC